MLWFCGLAQWDVRCLGGRNRAKESVKVDDSRAVVDLDDA